RQLTIVHTNDVHSRLQPINRNDGPCGAEDRAAGHCFGGYARIATMIKRIKAEVTGQGGAVLVLDAGDQFQGSLFFTTYKGAEV
ncbi:metallophosphoesterase, partial [Acinetobacter baumannii]